MPVLIDGFAIALYKYVHMHTYVLTYICICAIIRKEHVLPNPSLAGLSMFFGDFWISGIISITAQASSMHVNETDGTRRISFE